MRCHHLLLTCALAVGLLVPAAGACAFDAAKEADTIYRAISAGGLVPIASVPEAEKTEDNAYLVQTTLHKKMMQTTKDTVAGFKAGLTGAPQLKRFKAPSPNSAPLFASGLIVLEDPKKPLTFKNFPGMMLETEFAYKTAAPIMAPVADVAALKPLIASVHPAIEIPCLRFEDMPRVFFYDLTASGVGTRMAVIGPAHDPKNLDLNSMPVTLTRDGETVNKGLGADALGDQWQALLWLVNNAVKRHGGIEAGQYLLTGALGSMLPAKPGAYTATYPISTLTFTITE